MQAGVNYVSHPLHVAAYRGNLECVQILVKEAGVSATRMHGDPDVLLMCLQEKVRGAALLRCTPASPVLPHTRFGMRFLAREGRPVWGCRERRCEEKALLSAARFGHLTEHAAGLWFGLAVICLG